MRTLDEEVLLAHVLQVNRSYLLAHPERILTESEQKQFDDLLQKRSEGVPIAYLTGHREFWSLDFIVTRDTLIPRPETELLVELVLQQVVGDAIKIADLGTGSGAVALAIAHEKPTWTVHAVDISAKALAVAEQNRARFSLSNVTFHQGIWCESLPHDYFDVIVSNPPYIAEEDPHLLQGDLRYEPRSALVAFDEGLGDIKQILVGAKNCLKSKGYLMLEHGYQQGAVVRRLFAEMGYTNINSHKDLAGHERVTIATV